MLTATQVNDPLGATDVTDLVPVLISASGAITKAVDQMSALGTDVKVALAQVSELPDIFVRKAKGAAEEMGHATGAGFAKGFGWNILPPLAVGTGIVIGGLLLYSLAMRRIEPEYAR